MLVGSQVSKVAETFLPTAFKCDFQSIYQVDFLCSQKICRASVALAHCATMHFKKGGELCFSISFSLDFPQSLGNGRKFSNQILYDHRSTYTSLMLCSNEWAHFPSNGLKIHFFYIISLSHLYHSNQYHFNITAINEPQTLTKYDEQYLLSLIYYLSTRHQNKKMCIFL